jgi:LysR family transcriptional activator of nhaA
MKIDKKVRLVCYEDQFEALLADLALHKLDVVLTDREVQPGSALKVFSHQLFESEMLVVGAVPGVREQFYVISNERKIKHPAVEAILAAAQKGMTAAA